MYETLGPNFLQAGNYGPKECKDDVFICGHSEIGPAWLTDTDSARTLAVVLEEGPQLWLHMESLFHYIECVFLINYYDNPFVMLELNSGQISCKRLLILL